MAEPRIAVLMYHTIQDRKSAISISPELFSWQMNWLFHQDVQVITLDQLVGSLRSGVWPTRHTVVITFDDGYSELEISAIPILQKYQFPATIFIVSGYCGKMNDWPGQPDGIPRLPLLNWTQIRKMESAGIDFGVHTVNHPFLDAVDIQDAAWEIQFAKQTMEDRLGHPVQAFAYPYGRYNQRVKQFVAEEFTSACSTNLGFVGASFDPYAIERIDISYFRQPGIFKRLFEPIAPPYLTVRKLARTIASSLLSRPWK